MYGNAYVENTPNQNSLTAGEDPVKLAEFEARIAAGEKRTPGLDAQGI